MLAINQLHYKRGTQQVWVDLECQIVSGEVLGIVGPNGAGKSTLLGALSGILATKQMVALNGTALERYPSDIRAQHLAVLAQHTALNFGLTVAAVVHLGRIPHHTHRPEDERIVVAALTAMNVLHLRARDYLTLSGGEQQRVQLARVFAQLWPGRHKDVLLLDEPTSMLDLLHQHQTLSLVRTFAAQGAAVCLSVHDLNLAARYCDRLLVLKEGRSVAYGTPIEVLTPQLLQQVFDIEALIEHHPTLGHPVVCVC